MTIRSKQENSISRTELRLRARSKIVGYLRAPFTIRMEKYTMVVWIRTTEDMDLGRTSTRTETNMRGNGSGDREGEKAS